MKPNGSAGKRKARLYRIPLMHLSINDFNDFLQPIMKQKKEIMLRDKPHKRQVSHAFIENEKDCHTHARDDGGERV